MNKQKIVFIDRDGALIVEPPDHQVDRFDKLMSDAKRGAGPIGQGPAVLLAVLMKLISARRSI